MPGTYTEITEIVAPSEALAGKLVSVEARIRNLAGFAIYISSSAKFNDTIFYLYPNYATVGTGETYSFSGSFNMPSKNVRVYVWSYYWTGEEWYLDDTAYVDIALAAPPEVFEGKISRKELKYDATKRSIPVY